jgi:hypothetical protein
VTEPIQVPTIGEPELPAEIVTERKLEEIIQGSRVIHARHQGFTKAMARKLLDVQQENAKLREALKEARPYLYETLDAPIDVRNKVSDALLEASK